MGSFLDQNAYRNASSELSRVQSSPMTKGLPHSSVARNTWCSGVGGYLCGGIAGFLMVGRNQSSSKGSLFFLDSVLHSISVCEGVIGVRRYKRCIVRFIPILAFPHQGGRDYPPHPNPLPKREGTFPRGLYWNVVKTPAPTA